jgi:ribosomal protein S18 acetylase RimI-like enzyme
MQQLDYAVAIPADSNDVACLLAEVFSQSDPPAVAMGLSVAEMKQFLDLAVREIIPDGLTVTARAKQTRKLAGTFLAGDFATRRELERGLISSKFDPIFAMLEELDEQYRRGRVIGRGEYVHLFMLGVDSEFSGQGIAQGLVQACVENGARKGYRTAITEATGRVSQHIFRKNGFTDRVSISYRDFLFEDNAVFASIRDHEKAILMDRSLPS